MEDSRKNTEAVPAHLDQKNLIGFLESLHRLCRIGTYYPAGHAVLDQAVAHFRHNLEKLAEAKRSVLVSLRGETLLVQDVEVVTTSNAVRELQHLLADLGIATLEIDRAILLPELLQLIRGLLLGRAQLQGSRHFTQAEIVDIPSSVRIRQKEFLVDENLVLVDQSDEEAAHGLNTIFQVLADQGLERNQIERCRAFLNSFAERFAGRPISIAGLPAVSWKEVRRLMIRVIGSACQIADDPGVTFAENDLNALSAIFAGLEKEAEDKETQETINILVSAFGRNTFGRKQRQLDGCASGSKGRLPADDIALMPVGQLQSFVGRNAVEGRILAKLNRADRREELSILLQLLQFRQESAVEDKIRQILRDILTSGLAAKEVELLIKGAANLAAGEDAGRFRGTIRFIAALLRPGTIFSSQQFLVLILGRISPAAQTLLWPVAVGELLAAGRAADPLYFDELAALACRLRADEMQDLVPELETLDCFQQKKIAADIFDPTAKNTYPLFSILLETSLKMPIGSRVLKSLLEKPSDWLIEAVAPLLQLADPQHLKFLQTYLLVAQQKVFSVAMRIAAGFFVAHRLPEIAEQQRTEAWVARTILATPEMQVAETRPLLERIIEEKHMVVMPTWPSVCRKAAAEALKKLKRKPLTSARG